MSSHFEQQLLQALKGIGTALERMNINLELLLTQGYSGDGADETVTEPVAVTYKLVGVIEKANVRYITGYNAKGYPLMSILDDALGKHVQFVAPQILEVYPNQVRADGAEYYWLLVDNDGQVDWFLRVQDVALLGE